MPTLSTKLKNIIFVEMSFKKHHSCWRLNWKTPSSKTFFKKRVNLVDRTEKHFVCQDDFQKARLSYGSSNQKPFSSKTFWKSAPILSAILANILFVNMISEKHTTPVDHWTKKRFCQNALFVKMFFKESAPPIGRRTKKLSRRWPFLLSSINRTKNAAEVHKAAKLPLTHLCEGKRLKTKNQWGEGELVIFEGERFLSLQKLCFAQVVVRCKDASCLRHE